MAKIDQYKKEILKLLVAVEDEKEAKMLLKDLLTPAEMDAIAERWQVVKLLAAGKTQREVAKELGVSIQKVSHGAAWLRDSKGFQYFLKKLEK